MAKTKSLNIQISDILEIEKSKPHFDKVNPELAEEHYGSYVLYKPENSRQVHSRIYLDYSLGKYFRKALLNSKSLVNRSSGYSNYKRSKFLLIDLYPEYTTFIKDTVLKIVPENLTRIATINYLKGISIFLKIMRFYRYSLISLNDLKVDHQSISWGSVQQVKCNKQDQKDLYTFFNAVSNCLENFTLQRKSFKRSTKEVLGLPTTTLFQIDYYCRKEIEINLDRYTQTKQWLEEYKLNGKLFSLENLAYTFYYGYKANKIDQRKVILELALRLYNIKLNSWKERIRSNGKTTYIYENDLEKEEHIRLQKISQNGMNIMVKSEKMCFFWLLETIPNPLQPNINHSKYGDIISWDKLFHISRKVGISINDLRQRLYPTVNSIYPLYLFLLIREGLNDETLKSWKIQNIKKGQYKLGEDLGIVTIVQGIKSRSKDIQWTPIKNDSLSVKYINFYLSWLTLIYNNSGLNYFFQYSLLGGEKNYDFIRSRVWKKARDSKAWFFKKYKIYMPNGDIVKYIDHRQPRVNVQFNDYLKGLDEWERQVKKSHHSVDTQIHYDNMDERKVVQRHKLGKVLNLAEGIFRGTITEKDNKKVKVFNGLLADCKNPKQPTYPGAPKLSHNEVCSNWFMCLVYCDKSIVDFKVHGPPIFAYFKYMCEALEIMGHTSWEKEYGLQYEVAREIIEEKMTENQRKYSKEKMSMYYDLVRMKFKRKRHITKDSNAG